MKSKPILPPEIHRAFDGVIPFVIGSTDPSGIPNITFMSQLFYVDADHLAISCQFMNKSWKNLQTNPIFTALATHPDTIAMWRLRLEFLEEKTEGPIFEEMEMQLMALATPQHVRFCLRSALICKIVSVERIFDGMI